MHAVSTAPHTVLDCLRHPAGGDDIADSFPSTSNQATGSASTGGAVASGSEMVGRLAGSRVNNIFTHLRKVAQHPLLIRVR